MKCNNCGHELIPGKNFCTKCGAAVPRQNNETQSTPTETIIRCPNCGKALKDGQKFCTGCGTNVAQAAKQASEKGFIGDTLRAAGNVIASGARTIANAVTGNSTERRENEPSSMRDETRNSEVRTIREDNRQRDRRNTEPFNGTVDVVQGKAIWNIQPGEVARKLKQSELAEIEKFKGVIVDEGCTAIVLADGILVATLSSGNYQFYNSYEEERAAIKQELEKAEKELNETDRKAREEKKKNDPTFRELGILGEIGRGLRWCSRLVFGEKRNERKEKVQKRKTEFARAIVRATTPPALSVYLMSERYITMLFSSETDQNGNLAFKPYIIPTRIFDVEIGVSLQLKLTDIHAVATNYLADRSSLTTANLQQMLTGSIEGQIRNAIRNLDYQQTGLPIEVIDSLKTQIQEIINSQLHGIECAQILQITDSNADFERFRSVERELYCTERELDYLHRTGEFRNRLAIETNEQEIQEAKSEEELRYALLQINKDQKLHDDELEQFVMLLNAQKNIREAKSDEDERQAYIDIKKSGLVKDEELEILQDSIAKNKIQRESITEVMRIQNQLSIGAACVRAEWALDDMMQDHNWEREDLKRRREWGIADEERERQWQIADEKMQREILQAKHANELVDVDLDTSRKLNDHDFNERKREDNYNFEKEERQKNADFDHEQRKRDADWEMRQRDAQMRREDEQTQFIRERQKKFDDAEILERTQRGAMEMMQAMQEGDLNMVKESNRSAENIHAMSTQAMINNDNVEATMSAEALMAKRASQLDEGGQIAFAQALGSGKENELLEKQQREQLALYQQMLQMQHTQDDRVQERMIQMAEMIKSGMISTAGANIANQQIMFNQQQQFQQQRFEDIKGMKNEYRENAIHQQSRMDANNQMTMDSMAKVNAAAAGNIYTQNTNANINIQQPEGVTTQFSTIQSKQCPSCGEINDADENFCGNCGKRL